MKILNKKEIEQIEEKIKQVYGAENSLGHFVVVTTGKENKLWLASKKIFELELSRLRINSIGLYFGRIDKEKLRLSIEGANIVGKTAWKNIAEIEESSLWNFLRGFDVYPSSLINTKEGNYLLVKYKDDWIGIAKLNAGKLINVIPKSRKITSLNK